MINVAIPDSQNHAPQRPSSQKVPRSAGNADVVGRGFESRVAVITGASRGLGLALAQEFADHGWQVIGTGRSDKPAALPISAIYRQFDASNAEECEQFWQQLHKEYPDARICLVNNAGHYVTGGLHKTTPTDYQQSMNGTFFSAVFMTRSLTLAFAKARIITIISSGALRSHKNNSAYGSAKAAEAHFFKSLQQEFSPQDYQITNLYPDNIASHGPMPNAMAPQDLAVFVRQQAESQASYYLRDVTIWPI